MEKVMAKKLFALESEDSSGAGELMIDKVLKTQEKEKPGLLLTSQLIKQRHELKKEIQEEVSKDSPPEGEEDKDAEGSGGDSEDSGDDGEKSDDSSDEKDAKEDDDEEGGAGDEKDDTKDEDGDDEKKAAPPKDDEEDDVEVAADKDSLKSVIGSGLSGGDKGKGKETKESTESYKAPKVVKREPLFVGVVNTHKRYMVALEGMENLPAPAKPKQQPIVYVKADVLKGLDKLLTLSSSYVAKNTKKTGEVKAGLLKLAESTAVYSEYNNADKLGFTMKVVDAEDLLKSLAMPGVASLKTLALTLDKYMEALSGCFVKLISNDLSTLKTVFTSSGFTEKEGLLVMDRILPGFNRIVSTTVDYIDYLSVDYEDYQIYNTTAYKTQELYNIGGITLENSSDLSSVLKSMDGLAVHVGLFTDNLVDINVRYTQLISELKALHYDVETEKVKNLSELDIDSKLKDFIKFKMLSEGYTVCSDICVGFLTSANTALTQLLEVGEKSDGVKESV